MIRHALLAAAVATLASACVGDAKPPRESLGDVCEGLDEAGCVARSSGLASHDRDTLNLTLLDGRTLGLTGTPGGCAGGRECLAFRLKGYRPTENLFVVERVTAGGTKRTYVDRKTGDTLETSEARARVTGG